PELAERLVLVCSGGLGREVSWMIRALSLPGAEYVAPVIFPGFVRTLGDRVAGAAQRFGIRSPRLAEIWDAYATLTEPDHRAAFLRTVHAVIEPGGQAVSATDRLYLAAAMPTLIVWGDADPIIPVSHGIAAHDAMPGNHRRAPARGVAGEPARDLRGGRPLPPRRSAGAVHARAARLPRDDRAG